MVGSESNHQRALAAARALLADEGRPTARQVADRAGLSLSTYYRAVGTHTCLLTEAGHESGPATRDQLLDAARDLLDEVGFAGLVMDDVATRAGVSRGTLYRIFAGKADLLNALAQSRAPLAALGPMLEKFADVPPEQVLPLLVTAAVPRMMANRALLRAILAQPNLESADGGPARDTVRQMFAAIGTYIAGQMDAGRLRRMDPMVATLALLGPLHSFVVTRPDFWFDPDNTTDPDQVVTELVQIWLRGMQP
jgi:AcrR family transcriptional regulator